jgi:integrase
MSHASPGHPDHKQPEPLARVRTVVRLSHYSIRTEEASVQRIRRYILFHKKRHPLLFLCKSEVHKDPGKLEDIVWARKPRKSPVVLTREEVKSFPDGLEDEKWIMGNPLYGAGLCLMECMRMRVKDVDFGYRQIGVRQGKGL